MTTRWPYHDPPIGPEVHMPELPDGFTVTKAEEVGSVTIRLDRPGVAAVSHTVDAVAAIDAIADAAGLIVHIEED